MTPKTIMVVAGDPSGDANGAGLVKALALAVPGAQFIGAGGPKMAAAGVRLEFDLTSHSAIGPADAIKNLGSFWKRRRRLFDLAVEKRPELVILVDSYTFNQPLARAIKKFARGHPSDWQPKIVRYTSPQVWGSRPGRAEKMAGDIDLLLCLFPFEKDWYVRRGTPLRVEFVGHPLFDLHEEGPQPSTGEDMTPAEKAVVVLLPGSRTGEIKRHLPVMLEAAREISAVQPARFKTVALNEKLAEDIRSFLADGGVEVELQIGRLAEALSTATIAIASTGTVTMECAYFGLPTVAMYKVSPVAYHLLRWLVTIKYAAMPNILADEELFPEFLQGRATAQNVANAALDLLADGALRSEIKGKLRRVIATLGGPGSARRAAAIILGLKD